MSGRICSPFSGRVSSPPVGAGGVPVISSSAKGAPVMSSFTVVEGEQPRKLSEVASDEEQSLEDSGSGSREESSEKEGTSEGESSSESREGKPQHPSQEGRVRERERVGVRKRERGLVYELCTFCQNSKT